MPSIGIMLPGSTLYPSIGIDFLQGIRSCLKFHGATNIELHNSVIGYGLDEAEIYKEAEKFLLVNDADVVLACINETLAQKLSPLFAAAGKLLIITNTGANYPAYEAAFTHTIFHSLNDCLYSFMTGQLCGRLLQNNKAIVATSYYDGGYQHGHAMTGAFMLAGGEICFNYISHFKKELFNISALAGFIQNNPAIKTLLCLYCGDMARCFYEQIAPLQQQYDLQLYGSPMLFDSTPGDFAVTKPYVKQIKGYIGWMPALKHPNNAAFMAYFQNEFNKEANLFSLQGWEATLLAIKFLQQQTSSDSILQAIDHLKNQPVHSPRGVLRINNSNAVTAPAYFATATGDLDIQIEEVIDDTSLVWNEMMAQIKDTSFSNWRNTYLCI
jgi:branched-chain amino acid transport system substrate-binding protein